MEIVPPVSSSQHLRTQHGAVQHDFHVDNVFVGEEEVWEHFVELPGGAILLRNECGDGEANRYESRLSY